jgi:hypothetical protein
MVDPAGIKRFMNYQILQTHLVLVFLLQTAGSDPELSLAGKGEVEV